MRKSHKFDELAAIEETNNIPANNITDDLYPTAPRSRKRRVNEITEEKLQPENLATNAINDQMPVRQDELKEVPNVAVQQLVVTAGNESALQQVVAAQHHVETSQQQQQQPHQRQQQQQQQQHAVAAAAAALEQAAGPSYIQPLFTTPYGMPYPMQVGTPVSMPTAANVEHTSFLRHVLGQKISAMPSNIQHDQQQPQQDPNSLYNIHYEHIQHQHPVPVIPDQQQPQQQQSYAPQ